MKRLNTTLAEFQEKFESGIEPYNITSEQVKTMHEFDRELDDSGLLAGILRPGDRFPDFELPNQNGLLVKLSNLLLRGPVVISFFRGIWCPYCNIELKALQRSFVELEGAEATLIAISPQLPGLNKRTVHDSRLMYDVLSDVGNKLSDQVGITYRLSDKMIKEVYEELGVNLSIFNGDNSWCLPTSSRFVIDEDGVIISSDANVNYRKRTEPSETVAIVKAITRRAIL
ncbi:AhpC/TSA family protein [Thalassomonas viridans]|uniref:thioredoxin-dependent peroxiredoxin n=1 Tax=Thalassomonas viridans TaxID=137584 RepID=A0AAE9Z3Q5_9GAMM|nr:peroxiredoxin-like family protein [Thalassomonas viridans]WDE06186.1 AhpC/TSA family protein [Thalassomonas viridans]